MSIKSLVKHLITSAGWATGTLQQLGNICLHDRAFILMYHRVISSVSKERSFVQPGMYVLDNTFYRHIAFLKREYRVVPLIELLDRLVSGKNIGMCCAITFDDGWLDNYTQAFPILQEFQVPATVFLSTGFIGTNRIFWPDEFIYYLQQHNTADLSTQIPLLMKLFDEVISTDGNELFWDSSIEALKCWLPDDRQKVLADLRSISTPYVGRYLMNWNEVKIMYTSGLINFGAHTVNHVMLDQIPYQQAEDEIAGSQNEVARQLGTPVELFAYPNGNTTNSLQDILRKYGFRGAVTTRKGCVAIGCRPFDLPRIGMHEDVSNVIPLFQARILLKRF